MAVRTGRYHTLARNTASYATPMWQPIGLAREVTVEDSMEEVEVQARQWPVTLVLPGLRSFALTFEMLYDPADQDYVALESAYLDGTNIDLAALDGPIEAGTKGKRAVCKIVEFERSEPLDDTVVISVRAVPSADSPNMPSDITLS